jgi:hypothetical protein
MHPTWHVIRAALHCPYKAWQLIQEAPNEDIRAEAQGQILCLTLPVATLSPADKQATLAWFYGLPKNISGNINRLVLHGTIQASTLRTPALPPKKIAQLSNQIRQLLASAQAPTFYRNKHCPDCRWQADCLEKLRERDCISLLGGMSPGVLTKYHKNGIFSILQLSHLFRPRRRHRKLPAAGSYPWPLKALAIREQKTYVLRKPELDTSVTALFLDLEGLPEEHFIYLAGVVVWQQGKPEEYVSFWADNPGQEEAIFQTLAELLDHYPEAVIYHYGSYETKALKRWPFLKGIEKRMVNLLGLFRTHVFPPLYSNGLKELGEWLGYRWTDPEASGRKSIEWRKAWERTHDQAWKQKLLTYNQEDARALVLVKTWLDGLAETALKRHTPYHFTDNPEFGEDFQAISKAAYFDYQRTRIYWREENGAKPRNTAEDSNSDRHQGRGVPGWTPGKPDEVVDIPPLSHCPHCGHDKVYHSADKRISRQTDLQFTETGIRRWVREYRSGKGKCAKCGRKFNDSLIKMVHLGDNVFAWAVNLYVNYHVSHESLSKLLEEQFGIWTNRLYFMGRKEKWFQRFRPEVDQIWNQVRRSPVLHIDETQIRLSKDAGYVWVFATTDTVYYHLTLNRECEFLRERLDGYTGILVTDFFPGYEALPFRRQKCLIHLIRDMNDELFKNPFDEHYKRMVEAFGKLLRSIIETIDRYGLQRRHLQKHVPDTDRYFQAFVQTPPPGELSAKLAKRLAKHWPDCWTFLTQDGVPWNNNNAEAAIKAFALHRRGVNGKVNERRLRQYLEMLSLAQTCRYRNISFLDFLRGKVNVQHRGAHLKK